MEGDPRPGAEAGDGSKQRHLGHAAYTPLSLNLYDFGVLVLNNRFAWRCPTGRLLAMYQECVSSSHLDIGVGTGYFLDHVSFPAARPRIGLLDRNPNSLAHTARRLARYRPEVHRADILQPLALDIEPFDSIGMNYLLHCLPGPMGARSIAIENALRLLRADGVFFGSTILGREGVAGGPKHSRLARLELAFWNRNGVFGNRDDSLDQLRDLLASHFGRVQIDVCGCVASFRASR